MQQDADTIIRTFVAVLAALAVNRRTHQGRATSRGSSGQAGG
ncbi:hypothetical protein [Flaviflagellibacter deserti]|uniref:Uncharacterized protein n=1 Tax=Flaviflagellibacter deserti TaxID=2267266 RepID=A0ABV9Z023_9HYPH